MREALAGQPEGWPARRAPPRTISSSRAASGAAPRQDRRHVRRLATVRLDVAGLQQAQDADVSDEYPNPALLMVGSLVYDTAIQSVSWHRVAKQIPQPFGHFTWLIG